MTVERETAGFALPFLAGVLLATWTGFSLKPSYTIQTTAAFAAAATALALLMHPSRNRLSPSIVWILIGVTALSAGMVCGFTSVHLSIGHKESDIVLLLEGSGRKLQEAIDGIPFRDSSSNAIAKALITGERSGIPQETAEAFRISGASHILALSGLHLGIIYAVLTSLLSIAGNSRKIRVPRSAVTILACGTYTLATGAGPSIVRAFLFILLAETARLTNRYRSTGQLLFSALVIQLTLSPMSIRSAGFQLSYAAMAGIAFILPHLKAFWPGSIYDDRPFTKAVRRTWNAAAMSISCQLTTAPLAYYYFGSLPGHFLLTNIIALPLTGIMIPAILLTLVLYGAGICPSFILNMTEALIRALTGSLEIISTM